MLKRPLSFFTFVYFVLLCALLVPRSTKWLEVLLPTEPAWLSNLIVSLAAAAGGAIGGAFVVYLLEERKRRKIKREEVHTAIRRLYDEAFSNLQWLNDLITTRLYLRDEAWVLLKNQGYLSYMPKDILIDVANVYKYLHAVNESIRQLRDASFRGDEITYLARCMSGWNCCADES
jgi:hypothetical protein